MLTGCGVKDRQTPKKTEPAKIEHPSEGDIYRIMLTPKAQQRLLISTAPVERRSVSRTRTVGGSITIPDGAVISVTAPLTGTLEKTMRLETLTAGQTVEANQTVFLLSPLLAPEREVPSAAERISMANARASLVSSQITADGDVQQAKSQVEAARIALERAQRLFADKVGSQRDVDDAQGRLDLAQTSLDAAEARKQMLDALTLDVDSVEAAPVPVQAPQQGILRNVSSSVGQTVTAGSPLFEVVSLKSMWVRVPIYPGLRVEVDQKQNAILRKLGQTEEFVVTHVVVPPSADSLATTVDLFYELPNPEGRFFPGEPVEVVLPLAGETTSLVLPRAAILRDIHGIAWVYVNSAESEFRRHRVEVDYTTDALAVLREGPAVGSLVVVDGAAELFGTEFGAGK